MTNKLMKDKNEKELSSHEVIGKGVGRFNSVFLEFTNFLLHCVGVVPLHHLRRFCYRLAGVKIGQGSTIHMGARFYNPRNIVIGNDSVIGEEVVLDGRGRLTIGSHVAIASQVMIYNCEHNIHSEDFVPVCGEVIIEDYVFIGPRSIILPGVVIGKGAIIAAGAVVTKSVSPFTIVGGVPAEKIGERKVKELAYKLGRAAWFR